MVNVHIDPDFADDERRAKLLAGDTAEQLADILIDFKPRFIHHPEPIEHVRRIVAAVGAEPESSYADVPKLRTAFPQGGLSYDTDGAEGIEVFQPN